MTYSRTVNFFNNVIDDAIMVYGRDVTIVYSSTAQCSSCGYDPINKESTNIACSTCGGKYWFDIENTKIIKGVVKTFLGNLGHNDYALKYMGYIPEHEARLNCRLSEVLLDSSSATGVSVLDKDKNIRVEYDNKNYEVNATFRAGLMELKVIVATLKEINNE